MSTLAKDVTANHNKNQYDKCRMLVEKDEDNTIGDFQLYYDVDGIAANIYTYLDEDGPANLVPVYRSDVLPCGKDIDTPAPASNGSPPKKGRKSKKTNNSPNPKKKKKSKTVATTTAAAAATTTTTRAPTVVLRPPNVVYVEMTIKKAIHILATTDLLDFKGDVYAKLLKNLRCYVLGPVEKYIPPQNDPKWNKIKEAATCKSQCQCLLFLFSWLRFLTHVFCFILALKTEYEKKNEIVKVAEDGAAPVPFSREEFENFHKLYVEYNEAMKELTEKIYAELKGEIRRLDAKLLEIIAAQQKLEDSLKKLEEKEKNQKDFVIETVKAWIKDVVAWVVRGVLHYTLEFGCATIGFVIFVPVMALVWWYVFYFVPVMYW